MKSARSKKKWILSAIVTLIIVCGFLFFRLVLSLPQVPDDISQLSLTVPTTVYANNGEMISRLTDRQMVKISQISAYFLKAIIAIEDDKFWRHHGLNKKGLLRALITNLRHGRIVEGGSSITQQLGKNLFLSFSQEWGRKIKDMLIAMQLERRFSKDEILQAYCNQISFGPEIYGVEMAAQSYFAKHADELTLAEAAFLANLPRSPFNYNPYRNFDLAKKRQSIVLSRMVKVGFISKEEKETAFKAPLELKNIEVYREKVNYFIDYAKTLVAEKFGRDVVNYGGLKIYTTLDARLQAIAQEAVQSKLTDLDVQMGLPTYRNASFNERLNYPQAALVSVDPKSGDIKAIVGGRDFDLSEFNRAVQNNRLPGSSFKPMLYLTAIDMGIFTPVSVVIDSAVTFKITGAPDWPVRNFTHKHEGPMIIKKALMNSINVAAAKVMAEVRPENVIEYARKMGITSPLGANLSLALGTSGVSPLEMASAYCVFANGGIRYLPRILKYVESPDGKRLYEQPLQSDRVVDPQSTYLVVDMMKAVLEAGTARAARFWGFDRPAGGKTGTTNDYRDAWFIGYTPQLVAAVWVGFDDNRQMRDKNGRGITGARAALPIWVEFMKNALKNEPYQYFPIPLGIVFANVDPKTGQEVLDEYSESIRVAIKSGTKLTIKSTKHDSSGLP